MPGDRPSTVTSPSGGALRAAKTTRSGDCAPTCGSYPRLRTRSDVSHSSHGDDEAEGMRPERHVSTESGRNPRAVAAPPGDHVRLLLIEPIAGASIPPPGRAVGMTLDAADTLQEATALAAAGGYDALVADLEAAGPGALSIVAALRAGAPEVPVVVLTRADGEHWGIEALRQGAEDYLVKEDTSGEELAHVARRAAERARRRRPRTRAPD